MTRFAILFVIALPFLGNAQNNLEFGRPRTERIQLNQVTGPDSAFFNFVVPTGKVYKIETTGIALVPLDTNHGFPYIFSLNDAVLFQSGTMSVESVKTLIIWLPSGNYRLKLEAPSGNGDSIHGFISGLEFNLIP